MIRVEGQRKDNRPELVRPAETGAVIPSTADLAHEARAAQLALMHFDPGADNKAPDRSKLKATLSKCVPGKEYVYDFDAVGEQLKNGDIPTLGQALGVETAKKDKNNAPLVTENTAISPQGPPKPVILNLGAERVKSDLEKRKEIDKDSGIKDVDGDEMGLFKVFSSLVNKINLPNASNIQEEVGNLIKEFKLGAFAIG